MIEESTILHRLKELSQNTLVETLGIEFESYKEGKLIAKMPVTSTVFQPYKLLHGGATLALAETVGSIISALAVDSTKYGVYGLNLNGNHVKSVSSGHVFATAQILKKGKTIHLVEVRVTDDNDDLVSFITFTNYIKELKG